MIGVIDYGASNIQSIGNALTKLNQPFELVPEASGLSRFDKLILPGVGAAGSAMKKLKETGFAEVLPKVKVPVLGLCLGLQLFAEYSEENETKCLSIIPAKVRRFSPALKVPQMGWNMVKLVKESPLTTGIPDGSYFYFVHSYYLDLPAAPGPTASGAQAGAAQAGTQEYIIGSADYGVMFPAIIQKDNFYAVQFHPEKSGPLGLKVVENFCRGI
ncbi:MAG TPA: imidazole glycerol phosphate synthase subunit HisH [Candidatus Paceibacterota bacterium]